MILKKRLRNNGLKLYRKAVELLNDAVNVQDVTGPIGSVHQYMDTENVSVEYFNETSKQNQTLSLCKGALGFGYVGLDPIDYPFLEELRDFIKEPSEEMVQCQRLVYLVH